MCQLHKAPPASQLIGMFGCYALAAEAEAVVALGQSSFVQLHGGWKSCGALTGLQEGARVPSQIRTRQGDECLSTVGICQRRACAVLV
jgi:hypothetical protein